MECRCGAISEGIYINAVIDLRQDFNLISLAFFQRITVRKNLISKAHVRRVQYPSTKGEKYVTSRTVKTIVSGASTRWQTEAFIYVCKDLPFPLILGTDWLRSGGLMPTLNGNKLYLTHQLGPFLADNAELYDHDDPIIVKRKEQLRLLIPFHEQRKEEVSSPSFAKHAAPSLV